MLDIKHNEEAKALVESVSKENVKPLVVFFPDGTLMIEADITSIAEKTGHKTKAEHPFYNLIIVGAVPTGLAAAVYVASEGLHTLLIDKKLLEDRREPVQEYKNILVFLQV